MGLAASQARFLQCTARQTNVEYQGQQINNARTILANKSANAYNEMLTLKVPTPPSQSDFTTVQYAFKNNGIKYYLTTAQYNDLYNQLKNVTSSTTGYAGVTDTENKISYSRQFYNDIVTRYNTKIQTVPSNIIAGIFGFKAQELYKIDTEEARKSVKVDFNNK